MSVITKLMGRLTRRYDKTPAPVLGLRLSYLNGAMTWAIADDVLTTQVTGGVGVNLSVDLTQYTVTTLATYLASQPGYVVLYLDGTGLSAVSAVALVEGTGDISVSNGDHIYIAANPIWAYMSACSKELDLARLALAALPAEMATTTADGEWLDLLGSYYAVPRQLNEPDNQYSPRIPAEVILPRQNNVAIELALTAATGQPATVTDAVVYGSPRPAFDASIKFDSTHFFNASAGRVYNLFDLVIGYAALGNTTPDDYLTVIRAQVDRLRAAGTHLRNITLAPSVMGDTIAPPSDSFTEVMTVRSLMGAGFSANSGTANLWSLILASLATSSDNGFGQLSTTPLLQGNAFNGAGGMIATPVQIGSVSILLAGAGAVIANPSHTPTASASMAGAGGFVATAGAIGQFATATLAGSGGFTAVGNVVTTGAASMAGAGGLVVVGNLRASVRITLAGIGGFTWAGNNSPFSTPFSTDFGGP